MEQIEIRLDFQKVERWIFQIIDHCMSNFAYLYPFTPKIGTQNRVRAVLEFGEKLRVFLLLPNPLLDFFDFLQASIG